MQIKFKKTGKLLKTALKSWWAKDPFKESAVIAYYTIFSLPGLLMVILTIIGYFFGTDAVNNHLASKISSAMGPDTAKQIQDIIATASQSKKTFLASLIGIVTILVGATGVFAQFQKSLNMIWEVKTEETKSGIWRL